MAGGIGETGGRLPEPWVADAVEPRLWWIPRVALAATEPVAADGRRSGRSHRPGAGPAPGSASAPGVRRDRRVQRRTARSVRRSRHRVGVRGIPHRSRGGADDRRATRRAAPGRFRRGHLRCASAPSRPDRVGGAGRPRQRVRGVRGAGRHRTTQRGTDGEPGSRPGQGHVCWRRTPRDSCVCTAPRPPGVRTYCRCPGQWPGWWRLCRRIPPRTTTTRRSGAWAGQGPLPRPAFWTISTNCARLARMCRRWACRPSQHRGAAPVPYPWGTTTSRRPGRPLFRRASPPPPGPGRPHPRRRPEPARRAAAIRDAPKERREPHSLPPSTRRTGSGAITRCGCPSGPPSAISPKRWRDLPGRTGRSTPETSPWTRRRRRPRRACATAHVLGLGGPAQETDHVRLTATTDVDFVLVELHAVSGPGAGRTWRLGPGSHEIGSDPLCAIRPTGDPDPAEPGTANAPGSGGGYRSGRPHTDGVPDHGLWLTVAADGSAYWHRTAEGPGDRVRGRTVQAPPEDAVTAATALRPQPAPVLPDAVAPGLTPWPSGEDLTVGPRPVAADVARRTRRGRHRLRRRVRHRLQPAAADRPAPGRRPGAAAAAALADREAAVPRADDGAADRARHGDGVRCSTPTTSWCSSSSAR